MQERGLVDQVVAVDVVTGHFDGHDVPAGVKPVRDVPFIDAVPAMGSAGWAVGAEGAVDERAVKRGRRQPQHHALVVGQLDNGPKAHRKVHLALPAFGPDRARGAELGLLCHGRERRGQNGGGQQDDGFVHAIPS